MQPAELTPLGIGIFSLTTLAIFAFKNPRGYAKLFQFFSPILGSLSMISIGFSIGKHFSFIYLVEHNITLLEQDFKFFTDYTSNILFVVLVNAFIWMCLLGFFKLHELDDSKNKS